MARANRGRARRRRSRAGRGPGGLVGDAAGHAPRGLGGLVAAPPATRRAAWASRRPGDTLLPCRACPRALGGGGRVWSPKEQPRAARVNAEPGQVLPLYNCQPAERLRWEGDPAPAACAHRAPRRSARDAGDRVNDDCHAGRYGVDGNELAAGNRVRAERRRGRNSRQGVFGREWGPR